jgi:ABC-type multidrug transport system ATPase subunit
VSLLCLEGVSKVYGPRQERAVLREVSMEQDAGELAVVFGLRRSGRSTLLRVAAGIEPPSAGVVRFDGQDLAAHGERLLGAQIGYCQKSLRFTDRQRVLEHTMVAMLSRWVSPAKARGRARDALERVGAAHCANMQEHELSSAEAVRVAIARTLTLSPRMIVIDEPVKGVELTDRDGVLRLLRGLADEGIAVLASTGESTGLSEADRALVLGRGQLRGAPAARQMPTAERRALAPVLTLRQAR